MEFERANRVFGALDDAFIFPFSSHQEKTRSTFCRFGCMVVVVSTPTSIAYLLSTSQIYTPHNPKSRRRERGSTQGTSNPKMLACETDLLLPFSRPACQREEHARVVGTIFYDVVIRSNYKSTYGQKY